MKKIQKLLNRVSSKLTFNQGLIAIAILGTVTILIMGTDLKNNKMDMPLALIWILFLVATCIFGKISIYKAADDLIERETKACLEILKQYLSDEYKLVKYYPKNASEIFELYEEANLELYAKLDDDENICYALIDNLGNIISERKSKKYRFFLENIFIYKSFEN